MYVVMTRVALQPGTQDRCAALFERTNPELVRNEKDWLGARMIFDPKSGVMTVLAVWRDKSGYERLRESPEFRETMQQFSGFFAGPPEVSINDVLVEMTP